MGHSKWQTKKKKKKKIVTRDSFRERKNNRKPNPFIKTMTHRSNIY